MSGASNRGKSRSSGSMAWTGDAESITIWGERKAKVGTLKNQDEFELFGFRWKVERQARRTTLARGAERNFPDKTTRIQLKKSRLVDVPYTVVATP